MPLSVVILILANLMSDNRAACSSHQRAQLWVPHCGTYKRAAPRANASSNARIRATGDANQ
jgi:hypothetical protein